jgi:hypothetical protein
MNYTDSPEIAKNTKNNNDAWKSPQEIYDKYTKKGDDAVIAEGITLAEKYYQHANHCLRAINASNHFENDHVEIRNLSPSLAADRRIARAFKGIMAQKAAKAEAFRKKVVNIAKSAKVARSGKKDKPVKTKSAQVKVLNGKRVADKKLEHRVELYKINFLQSRLPGSDGTKKN